ncbi:MAG: ribonuclease P protein component [Tenericutes bacterium]|nr:ribonuclease P protein component [Mycoplasmatota bacterium]
MKKAYRIKKSNEIQDLIKIKKTVGNSYFILYYNKNHDCENFRYAISVPKKYGNAVFRNLIKRRIREIIKVNNFNDDYDFFIVTKQRVKGLKFKEIKRSLEKLFEKANILRK